MEAFINELQREMNDVLQKVSTQSDHILKQAEGSYQVVQQTVQRLKDFILDYTFKDLEEEIWFFKTAKPNFLKELIYFEELFYIESGRPVSDREEQRKCLEKHLDYLSQFFKRNNRFYTYYRVGKTYNDETYFSRKSEDMPLSPDQFSLDIDDRFCTSYSFKIARFQAYEKLGGYLNNAIAATFHTTTVSESEQEPRLKWTAPKVALVELVYALKAAGVFNNGTANINEIAGLLEKTFQRDLSEFYRTFQEIRIRKKSRTAFIDLLQSRLEQWMDDADRAG